MVEGGGDERYGGRVPTVALPAFALPSLSTMYMRRE